MVILTGENLGKRQQDLNKQVHDAATHKDDFEKIKIEPNSADVDVLFKIDLASKYKNIDYILDVLKSGDSLYISRALKCTWLYDDEYSNFINVDYLHHNIFPSMSSKMKCKFLTTISMYVKNGDRAESFYKYCNIAIFQYNIALKFLIFTSESFKIEIIERSFNSIIQEKELFYKNFVGNSFTLATAIMKEALEYTRSTILYYLRYLISVSENAYLDLLEKYDCSKIVGDTFGLRISTTVLKKHRGRFLEHPLLYLKRLNKNVITKYINVEDAKIIVDQILPADCEKFWGANFYSQYDFLLNKIPADEKFTFVKNIYNKKYPDKEFEMTKQFLNLRYYELMTVDEREAWALRHIETNSEIQGVGCNYKWYEYVNFKKAFPEIKNIILKTPGSNDRHDVVQILEKTVRNLTDMKTLLTYYYNRHINEIQFYKQQFVSEIIRNHNVFEFDTDCWTALNKLLHSMNVYKSNDTCRSTLIMYTAVIYHIIHNIELPKALTEYILEHDMCYSWDRRILNEKLSEENKEKIYQYIVKVYINKITALNNVEHQDDNKVKPYVQRYIRFLEEHNKSSDDCPDVIMQFVKTNWNDFQNVSLFKKKQHVLTQADLMRQLKKDSKLVVENLPEVKNKISTCYPSFNMCSFLKKLKVYFPNDVSDEYLKMFMETLTDKEDMSSSTIGTAVYGIFQLADEQTKIDFMSKYAPTEAKIKHDEIDQRLLGIQKGICRSMCFSRPPVPLSNVLKYITGDYLRFCLPMFQSYQVKLPQPLLQEFVTKLIEAPVSVQKHALRLLFECYSIENLKKALFDIWKRTKNISIRYVLYQSLCKKIRIQDENTQLELFEVLKNITAELKDDDNIDLYKSYMRDISMLPEKLCGEYIIVCWQTVSKFPDKTENFKIKKILIDNITCCLHLLDGNFVKEIVEDHVKHMLVHKNIRFYYENTVLEYLYEAKWKLVYTYIIFFCSDVNFEHKNMNLVKFIINKCVEMWHEIIGNIFIFRKFCWKFIDDLIATSTNKCCVDALQIFDTILIVLKDSFALPEFYQAFWTLKLTMLRRKTIQSIKLNYNSTRNPDLLALVRHAVHEYGLQVGKLVKENVDSKSYCVSMNETLGEMIKDNINDVMNGTLGEMINDNINDVTCVDINEKTTSFIEGLKDIDILAAKGLMQVRIKEAYLLALYILPMDSDTADYGSILNKIKCFKNVEVQTCWYNKFVYSDFKRRKLE